MPDKAVGSHFSLSGVETLSKVLVAVGLACYASGLLTVNQYLRQYGYSDFSLLRTRFILTGAFSMIPLLLAATVVFVFFENLGFFKIYLVMAAYNYGILKSYKLKYLSAKIDLLQLSILVVALIEITISLIAVLVPQYASFMKGVIILFASAFVTSFIGGLLFFSYQRVLKYKVDQSFEIFIPLESEKTFRLTALKEMELMFMVMLLSLMLLLGFTIYFHNYAVFAYPRLSEQVGGGEPKLVQMIIFDDDVDEARDAGIVMDGNSHRSIPLPLLWEGDSTYLVSYQNFPVLGWTAQIDKQLVAGLVTYTEPTSASTIIFSDWRHDQPLFATPENATDAGH